MKFPKLKNKLILAPIANYSDIAFRVLCRHYGASLAYTEMLNANSLIHNKNLLQLDKKDRPLTLQLAGNNPELLYKTALLFRNKIDVLDLNLGCPSYNVIRSESGSFLLNHPERIDKILKKLSSSKIPLSIKLRIHKNLDRIVKIAEKNKVSAICLHARSIKKGYSEEIDLDAIKKLKEKTKLVVIGNGNIFTPEDAYKMLNYTKCDYIMIGRASLSNPYIFTQIQDYLKNKKYKKENKIEIFKEYYKLYKKYKINNYRILLNHALNFTKSLPNSRKKRLELSKCKNEDEIVNIINSLKNKEE